MTYKDGSTQHIFEEQSKGSPMKPFTPDEHMKKLDDLTDTVIGKAQADRLWGLVDALDPKTDLGEITGLLAPVTEKATA